MLDESDKVQEAADELELVNDALSDEVDTRTAIEDELSQSQTALAASRLKEMRDAAGAEGVGAMATSTPDEVSRGMAEKAAEFREGGGEIYVRG